MQEADYQTVRLPSSIAPSGREGGVVGSAPPIANRKSKIENLPIPSSSMKTQTNNDPPPAQRSQSSTARARRPGPRFGIHRAGMWAALALCLQLLIPPAHAQVVEIPDPELHLPAKRENQIPISSCASLIAMAAEAEAMGSAATVPPAPGVTLTAVGSIETAGSFQSVVVSDGHAYVADTLNGLKVFDLANPAKPVVKGELKLYFPIRHIAVSDRRAYALGDGAFSILEIGNSAVPTVAGTVAISHASYSAFAVEGTRVYLAKALLGGLPGVIHSDLSILNVSSATNIVELGNYRVDGQISALASGGNHAFLVKDGDLEIIDVSDPATPVRIGGYSPGVPVVGMTLAVNHAFVAVAGQWGLPERPGVHVLNISDPSHPVRVGKYDTHRDAARLAYSDGRLYVVLADLDHPADGELSRTELHVLDVREPSRPVRLNGGDFLTADGPFDMEVTADHILVANGARGLLSYRLGEAPRLTDILQLAGERMELRFAANGSDPSRFVVQSAATLTAAGAWVAEAPIAITYHPDGTFHAVVHGQGDARFYRVTSLP